MDTSTIDGPREARTATPFGRIVHRLETGAFVTELATFHVRASDQTSVLVWQFADATAELLLYHPTLNLLPGEAVTDCVAALWRVRADRLIDECRFECRFEQGSSPGKAGYEGSQAIAACSWQRSGIEVMLAAPDAEGLLGYKRTPLGLPRSWAALIDVAEPFDVAIEEYLPDGLRLTLPEVHPGETGQVHFALAWASTTQEAALWHAVHVTPITLRKDLAQAF
jgi:hypothetical protein